MYHSFWLETLSWQGLPVRQGILTDLKRVPRLSALRHVLARRSIGSVTQECCYQVGAAEVSEAHQWR